MNNLFCKQCKYNLTIKKKNDIKIITLQEPSEFTKINIDTINNYELKFTKENLISYLKDKKFSKEEKQQKIDLYENLTNKKLSIKYILKCLTCGNEYPLEPETIIYSIDYKKQNVIFNDEDIELKINDPTLPRTKDYKCKNINCITNKDNNAYKEAVFYRGLNTYYLKYACVICKYSWHV